MRLFTADALRRADEDAAAAGVPTRILMEAAGAAVAAAARRHWPDHRRPLVLCGRGANGGDGYVAARYLALAGLEPEVLGLGDPAPAGDAAAARAAWRALGGTEGLEPERLGAALARCDLVIDALFGTGLTRPLEGDLAEVVRQVNTAGVPVLAVDLPSGVAADRAHPPGPHLRARRTVQLAGPVLASAFEPARSAFGLWEVAAIGIPPEILAAHADAELLDDALAAALRPARAPAAHKYVAGTVAVIAGSERYLGAAELACRGAHRAGAGLVTLAAESRAPSAWPETVLHPLDWAAAPRERLAELPPKRAGALVIGPGLDERARQHLPWLLAQRPVPTVLDAEALVPELREAVRSHGRCVLTPHAGEAARLLGRSAADIDDDRLGAARELAASWNAVAVVKGAGSAVAAPDGRAWVSPATHPGLASGGTGDVLAGAIGALVAGAEDLAERAAVAVHLHGRAGERAAARLGDGLVASDVAEELAPALRALEGLRAHGG